MFLIKFSLQARYGARSHGTRRVSSFDESRSPNAGRQGTRTFQSLAGGQYCALLTKRGLVVAGIYDIDCANEFHFAFALAKGTPAKPLVEPEDLYEARIVRVSNRARALGISEGMTGLEASVGCWTNRGPVDVIRYRVS